MASLFSRQAWAAVSKAKPSAFRPLKAAPVAAFSPVPRRFFSVTLNRLSNNIPKDLKYTQEHEWVRVEGNKCKVGVTDHAQTTLGDIVFLELPEVGTEVEASASFGVIESVKAASDLYAPVSGKVVAVNEDIVSDPEDINSEPYDSWLVEIEYSNQKEIDGLMTPEAYAKATQE